MGTGKRENIEQIPTEDEPQGKTGKVVSEQGGVEGQRKEVNVVLRFETVLEVSKKPFSVRSLFMWAGETLLSLLKCSMIILSTLSITTNFVYTAIVVGAI